MEHSILGSEELLMTLSINNVWTQMLSDVLEHGLRVEPRGIETRELLSYQTRIDMTQPVVTVKNRIEGKFFAFMCAEAAWILSGDNRTVTIEPYSRMIKKFSDDGHYFSGAYGPKIVDQLTYVVDTLVSDPDSRQAVINIWRENPRPTKDYPCTLSIQWLIRDGYLHCFDTMRSSDVWLGWPFDVFNFSMLTHMLALLIRDRWKRQSIARPPLKIGKLCLTAASQHIYERNFSQAAKCVVHPEPVFELNPLDPYVFEDHKEFIAYLWNMAAYLNGDSYARTWDMPFLRELVTW
ncbi:MAG: thymidylate synthase [Desulfurellales bacterium]|nr:MAG: thymidylate synthase [Desulfurellales bacterium]